MANLNFRVLVMLCMRKSDDNNPQCFPSISCNKELSNGQLVQLATTCNWTIVFVFVFVIVLVFNFMQQKIVKWSTCFTSSLPPHAIGRFLNGHCVFWIPHHRFLHFWTLNKLWKLKMQIGRFSNSVTWKNFKFEDADQKHQWADKIGIPASKN